jgi:plastocyanin
MAKKLQSGMQAAMLSVMATLLAGCSGNAAGTGESSTPERTKAGGPAAASMPAATEADKGGEERPAANQVVIDNFTFDPPHLTVTVGAKVTWVNHDDVPHTATSTQKPRAFDSRTLDTDQQFSHVFTKPGIYKYFCAVHPHMTGEIIVKNR